LLLDREKIEYINREMTNCVLSLDGRREVNDKMRPTVSGKGSYDVVLPKFRELIETRTKPDYTDCYVRGTFTAHNLDFAEDVVELARLGFRNISLEPVICNVVNNESDYSIRLEHIPQIYEQYDRLFMLMKSGELDINFFHFNVDLSGGACVIRRLRGCGAGNEYLAVAPDGSVYPCHRFVGDGQWNMATVINPKDEPCSSGGRIMTTMKAKQVMSPKDGLCSSGGRIMTTMKSYFTKTHIYSKSDCPSCWARFYCSGGCNATSFECFGDCRVTDADSVDCLMMKKRLECAIALNALRV
jgi:uncharacterized protein